MKRTKDIMLTENTVAEAIEAIHTCGIPEVLVNQMGAHTATMLRTALENVLDKSLSWAMLYNSGLTIENTNLNSWRLVTSETINELKDIEPVFHAVYDHEVVFFERQPGLEENAGLVVSAYSHGDAEYNSMLVKDLISASITICNTFEGIQETFGINSMKLDDLLSEVVHRLQNEEMGGAYIVAVMPSTKKERCENGSRWTMIVLPKDALTAHGSSRVNRLHSWDIPKGSKVAVIGSAKKLEEKNPELAFQPEDIRVQFYYSWHAMRNDPDVGALVTNYSPTLRGPDEDDRHAYVEQAEPFSVSMAAFHQQEFGTTRLLYTEAVFHKYYEGGRGDEPIMRLHDLSGKESFFWLRMKDYDGFELRGGYDGGIVIAATNDDASLLMINEAVSKIARKLKDDKDVTKRKHGCDDDHEDRMVKAILRAMATEVIAYAAQTMSCTPLINSDIMDKFIDQAFNAVRNRAWEDECKKRAVRSKTIAGKIRNMF